MISASRALNFESACVHHVRSKVTLQGSAHGCSDEGVI